MRPLRFLSVAFFLMVSTMLEAAPRVSDEFRVGGFVIGPQLYSFKFFTLFEAIEKSAATGGRAVELTRNLKLSPDNPAIFNHESPDDLIPLVKAKLAQHGVKAVNYGVVPIPNHEAAARKVFEFARKMELSAIITESIDSLDLIEKLAKEYDIDVGIHQHARKPGDPDYKIWDPAFVRELLKNRDRRLGACADGGHWQTSGIRAIDGLKTLEGRIVSLHLKERAALGPNNTDCIFGTGITDIPAILAELRRQNFRGNVAIEYEFNWQNSVPDIAQCIGFVRGWAAANP
ncbi:MAG TPA: TIM barrel protein [Opitutaceae bacterium]|nr:TIM barrel protein [Opitutaceae bacterium]